MTLHELHPEELIDKAARTGLDANERATLDRHLSSCAVCRFETRARVDFRDHEETFSDDAIDQIVRASLRGADAKRKRTKRESVQPRPYFAGNPRRRRWAVLLTAAVLLVSAQAAARWLGVHAPSWLAPPTMTTVTPNGTEAKDSKSPATPKSSVTSKEQPAGLLPIPETPSDPSSTPAPQSTSQVATPYLTPHSAKDAPVRSSGSTSSPRSSADDELARTAPIVPSATASALFTQANADRTLGRHMIATHEYRDLLDNYPNAPEADLTRATLGRLLLDDGDALGALAMFDSYLHIGGPLREETMVNRATALERLHRIGEESAAWRALLDAYPQSMHADRARDRLKELDAR
ncbi:MAG: hypothetical protein ABI461_20945 [Polyangiaceae bacterium]